MPDLQVGLIGLGNMGGNMGRRLLERGFALTAFDLDTARLEPLVSAGATAARSPRDVAERADLVLACLPSQAASLAVATGDDGVVHGGRMSLYIETSTLGRSTIETLAAALAARGVGFLDMPVSGGTPRARNGTLSLLVSGRAEHVERARPVLDALGNGLFHLGSTPGLSQVAKLINNHVSAAGRVAVLEGLAMGAKAGMDLKVLNDVLNASTGMNYTTVHKVPAAVLSDAPYFNGPLSIGLKDEALFIEEARHQKAALWLAPRILELYREAAAAGFRDEDSMRLLRYIASREAGPPLEPDAG